MPFSDPPQPVEEVKKKPNNLIWLILVSVLLGPAVFLAANIIAQPAGNQTYFNLNRPDEGVGFDIQFAEIVDEELNVTVSYSGGCDDHTFDLYVEDQQSDINRLLEIHHQTEDTCDTRVTEDLKYDIGQVIDEHDSEQIVFTISGNGKNPDPILYEKPLENAADLTP